MKKLIEAWNKKYPGSPWLEGVFNYKGREAQVITPATLDGGPVIVFMGTEAGFPQVLPYEEFTARYKAVKK